MSLALANKCHWPPAKSPTTVSMFLKRHGITSIPAIHMQILALMATKTRNKHAQDDAVLAWFLLVMTFAEKTLPTSSNYIKMHWHTKKVLDLSLQGIHDPEVSPFAICPASWCRNKSRQRTAEAAESTATGLRSCRFPWADYLQALWRTGTLCCPGAGEQVTCWQDAAGFFFPCEDKKMRVGRCW